MAEETHTWAPGVHLKVESRRPAPAFETGVPVFLGRLSPRGPLAGYGQAVLPLDYTSWSALGVDPRGWAEGHLGFAVRGFFENGGRRCLVVPLGAGGIDTAVLETLETVEDFDLVCAPEAGALAQVKLVDFFRDRTRGFLLLDTPPGRPAPGLPASLRTVNAALHTPWLKVRGACAACQGTGLVATTACSACMGTGQGLVPPSGHVAGLYARTDWRGGVHKAPANEVLEGVLDLELHLGEGEVALLNQAGINCIRAFPGRGIRLWGARTLAPDAPDFAFVNTRRVFLTVARWLELSMADIAFEPNDLRLWARLGRDVSAFLEGLFRRGALVGASAAEAFYVKCDAETNPPQAREAGKVVTEVGLALAKPNEFIVVHLISNTSGTVISGAPGSP